MRLKARVCPKGCRKRHHAHHRQRMLLRASTERVERKNSWRFDILLDWHCPQCNHGEPVTTDDLRIISKYPVSHAASRSQRKYYPELEGT